MNTTKLVEVYKEHAARMAELEKKTALVLAEHFKEITKVFFEKVPEVHSVFWTQYTPYFMDGDVCEFGVNDIEFLLTADIDKEDDDEYSEGSCIYSQQDYDRVVREYDICAEHLANPRTDNSRHFSNRYSENTLRYYASQIKEIQESLDKYAGRTDIIIKELDAIESAISSLPDSIMQAAFGDGVRVTITKNGLTVEEYSHD